MNKTGSDDCTVANSNAARISLFFRNFSGRNESSRTCLALGIISSPTQLVSLSIVWKRGEKIGGGEGEAGWGGGGGKERERERQRDRERQTETETQTDRQTETETETHTQRERERQTDREV